MISVSSRDGREAGGGVLGVGRGTGENEHEEGEALSFRDGDEDDDDRIIDPDISLSYIDEKIKNLLGHVQKDFEGGVSAENLGAKFGGYGSFLPTYKRSPVCSHSKSPVQTKNPSVLCSPRRSLTEGNQLLPTISSSPSHTRQHYTSSCNIVRTLDHKSSPSHDNIPVKVTPGAKSADVCNSTVVCYKNISPRNGPENNPANPTDQKMLKLRIKVGSDNILTQKNAEIYSGLGLDVSPSSSLGSPRSEGLPQEPLDVPCVSPVSILQIMTTFLDDGERMLTPLSDNLLYLIREENTHKEDNDIFNKGGEHFIPIVQDGATPIHDDGMFSRRKASKSEKKTTPNRLEKEEDVPNEITVFPKEMAIDRNSGKKQVSDFSTFPTSTNTHFDSNGLTKQAGEFLFHMGSSEGTEEERLAKEGSCYPYRGLNFTGNIGENRRTNVPSGISTPPIKNAYIYSAFDSLKASLNNKELKTTNNENIDPPKPKAATKKISGREKAGMRESSKEHRGGKEKPRDPFGVDSSTSSKNKNKFRLDGYPPKEKSEYTKQQNPTVKSNNGYSNFLGETNIDEDGELGPVKLFSDNWVEDNEMINRSSTAKEKVNSKNTDRSLKSGTSLRTSSTAGFHGGDRSNADAPIGAVAPSIIKENWVCCDKCQKWRLLPPGTNPEDLPEKWICSMLNWLTGMNRCSISEDETTKSLFACYYQAPDTNLADSQNCDPNHKNNSLHPLSNEAKKKNTTKNIVVNTTNQENSSFSTHSEKVSNVAGRSRSFQDEKHTQKPGDKRRMPSHSSDGAGMRSTTKSKRVLENECSKITEQVEECMNNVNGDSISGNPNKKKANSISDNVFSSAAMGKSRHGKSEAFKKYLKFGTKDGTEAFGGNRKPKIHLSSINHPANTRRVEDTGASNKKKGKAVSVNEMNSGSFSAEGNQLNGNNVYTKEETTVVRVKQKKQKYVKSEGMEFDGVNTVETDGVCVKDRKVSQISKISTPLQNSAAVLSSPSKIKGSQMSKVVLREHKSSPIGSNSSSPLMISNPDKAASYQKKIQRNREFKDAGFVDSGSTGRCSLDDEFSARNNPVRLSRMEKNENSTHLRSVESPVLDFREVNNKQLPVTLPKQHSENPYEFTSQNIPSFVKNKATGHPHREQIHENRPQEKLKERNKKSSEKSTCSTDQIAGEKKRRLLTEDPDGANNYKFSASYYPEIASENPIEGRSSKRAHFDETSVEPSGNEKSHFPAAGSGNATLVHCQQQNENKSEKLVMDKRRRREERQNESKKASESASGSDSAKELEIRGLVKKEVRSLAVNNTLKEAKNLKHVADRLKNSGVESESRGIYFQAALKFLHSASMSESCSDTSHGDIHAIELYKSTAKFCQFCAHEFERAKDMAYVALAYKCMEVASMRVVYCSYTTASRDCHELQMVPLTIIPGESPCSSASDVDNVNNNLTADKVAPSKVAGSPRVLGNHVIAARNRPNFLRLLNFTQDVQFAMDCSRRSHAAFAAAVEGGKEGFSEVKKALDFGFQDVDGLLHLIRVAMEATTVRQ